MHELLEYFPESGFWVWRINHGTKIKAGQPAGHKDKRGYVWIGINGRLYLAHRLAHFYQTGEWPPNLIDHRDRDKSNNRWNNIRPATVQQNLANCGKQKSNTSGFKNVYFRGEKRRRPWAVQIRCGKLIYYGCFATIEEADAAAEKARVELFGEFARG